MRIAAFIVSIVLFFGAFALFAYSFEVAPGLELPVFLAGLIAICLALAVPVHLLKRLDR